MEDGQIIDPAVITEAVPLAAPQVDGTDPQLDVEIPAEKKTFTQEDMDDAISKRTAKLLRQRDTERGKREILEQQATRTQQAAPQEGRPTLGQFANADDYADAVGDWKLSQAARQQQAETAQKTQSTFAGKRDDLMSELEDADGFDVAKFNKLPISMSMAEAIVDSDQAGKLSMHLIAHPDEAARIATLSPARQAAEIGKLEAKLSTVPAKKPSNAPSPITPVGAKGSTAATNLYDPKLANDAEAWIAARRAQKAAKR